MSFDTLKFAEDEKFIKTISGRRFFLHGSGSEGIYLPDITHALSHIGRFTGHTTQFHSVANHSLLVAEIAAVYTSDKMVKLQALMHDSPEAYLADIATPFKGELANYKTLERRVWERIANRFGIDQKLHSIVKVADRTALFVEVLMYQPHADVETWKGWDEYGEYAQNFLRMSEHTVPDHAPPVARRVLLMKIAALISP